MRASRLLSILILLQMRGRISAEALASEFEVSVRTIYRDADHLSAAGVPIYAERGRAGGFQLLEGYHTRLTGLSAGEAQALILSGLGETAGALGLGAEAAAAQLKLLASLPPDSGASAQKVARRFHLDPAGWYQRSPSLPLLPDIARAVWSEKRMSIAYESWRADVRRVVDPLGVVLKGGHWYLVGAVDGKPRVYRVSNIRGLSILDQPAQRPRGFDLAKFWTIWARDFEARLLTGRAQIALSPEGLRRLREINALAAEVVQQTGRPDRRKDWVTASVPVESIPYTVRQVLSLGAEIRVIGPSALARAVADEARRVARLYRR